ncbi:Nucleoside-diphosphate-sugar epimerase [Kaistia soli DSM 19436]|uniref:Nucleoside-diphosphate-sugar epimerase n=1 Tax=Kaistia soli DSM 19436 TaxID=1122133 RepID=A0A1M5MIF3_9HYPH|nr:NAD-dependent epimerase/dehydratase family protein [Kaistia soli]SHG76709.1 Nucleoside-diphosphate-sugar epimerase [Kaistia soli DSM 19436]
MTKTILVIGATGGVGGAVARVMAARGWTVRGLARDVAAAQRRWSGPAIAWVEGDAMKPADVVAAAAGVSAIFHGANPPGYKNWAGVAMPMLDSTIAAAKANGARIVFPGTVYNYGPDALPLVAETAPQKPVTRKGRIRVAMEARLAQVASEGVPVIILRAGDFFGPSVGNSWFGQGIVKPRMPVKAITYPGKPDIGHAFAYLPDLAETFAQLIERADELPVFAPFHFRGHFFEHGIAIAEAVRSVIGKPEMKIGRFPWWAIYAGAPFVETFREILEMRYLWKERLELDNGELVAFLGSEPHTPTPMAIRTALEGLGCLTKETAETRLAPAFR